ncbi:RagB/SusD family nutrient uptake outer membrane protein [Pinibacter aurantiacus]|uniref:RagB/SusD family nutrient uptake outer membrane protein n=1 Tax=Pinibacter aurantiacus TaxID=2851599 RepID=A0A9E2S4V4_9BACT|nr:RagB/SusD family nutrient uptake outer membrane protein [Pinibacter aurantiacus]MBV4356678.1 RagB/SusD family nutrient uptake outer membrane protein [Pinibacter aurantiacus]
MRKLSIYAIAGVLMVAAGCSKFLGKAPDNRTTLDTPEKVSQLLATAYPQANYMAFTESISDNVTDKGAGGTDHTTMDPYFFKDVQDNQQDSPEYYWNACYSAIAAANHAYAACVEATEPQKYIHQKGEALVARAYAHFMLTTIFAKRYDAKGTNTSPGVPYVTEPEEVVVKQYDRKTVAYDYEMIEKDLQEGMPLLDDNAYAIPKYHFTKAAAHAFAARFYLYKQQYDSVIKHATAVFGTAGFANNLRPWNTDYLQLNYNELFARYAKSTENANILLVETASWWARSFVSSRYGFSAAAKDDVFRTPVTSGTWSFTNQLYSSGEENFMVPKINEYFVRTSVNANTGYGYVMVPIFTAEEALFNRAEAYILKNDITSADNDLNLYMSKRINNYSPASHSITANKIRNYYGTTNLQAGYLAALMDFKRAEFVQEGMRWFDLARYNVPVVHAGFDNTSNTNKVDTLKADDNRRMFQIPQATSISGLEPNPR